MTFKFEILAFFAQFLNENFVTVFSHQFCSIAVSPLGRDIRRHVKGVLDDKMISLERVCNVYGCSDLRIYIHVGDLFLVVAYKPV